MMPQVILHREFNFLSLQRIYFLKALHVDEIGYFTESQDAMNAPGSFLNAMKYLWFFERRLRQQFSLQLRQASTPGEGMSHYLFVS